MEKKDDFCLRTECSCSHNWRSAIHRLRAFRQNNPTDPKQQTCGFYQSSLKSKSKNTCKDNRNINKNIKKWCCLFVFRIRKLAIANQIKRIKTIRNNSNTVKGKKNKKKRIQENIFFIYCVSDVCFCACCRLERKSRISQRRKSGLHLDQKLTRRNIETPKHLKYLSISFFREFTFWHHSFDISLSFGQFKDNHINLSIRSLNNKILRNCY